MKELKQPTIWRYSGGQGLYVTASTTKKAAREQFGITPTEFKNHVQEYAKGDYPVGVLSEAGSVWGTNNPARASKRRWFQVTHVENDRPWETYEPGLTPADADLIEQLGEI